MNSHMKLLILGKNGQIGSSLVAAAKKNHIAYRAAGRDEFDITNQHAVHSFFSQAHDFDFIINAAAYTDVDHAEKNGELAHAVNCLAVKYIAEMSKKYNIPVIHLSTDYVFDGEKVTGYDETDLPNPKNVYGQTKLAGENMVRRYCEQHIILRVSWIFSEFGKNFVKTIAQHYDQKDVFFAVCDQIGSPTSAHSVAETIIRICQHLHQQANTTTYWGTYHYTNLPATNWHQFATYVVSLKEKHHGVIKEIRSIEAKEYPTVAQRPKNSILNNTKIKKQFGIEQTLWTTEVDRVIHLL